MIGHYFTFEWNFTYHMFGIFFFFDDSVYRLIRSIHVSHKMWIYCAIVVSCILVIKTQYFLKSTHSETNKGFHCYESKYILKMNEHENYAITW